jgi:NhaP-type Na+/H+ or K+/H+ antiporter
VSIPDSDPVVTVSPDTVRIRRAPKFGAFIVVGALVGFLVTLALTAAFPIDANDPVGFIAYLAYFELFGIPVGAVLGAVLAIVLDAVSRRRARQAEVEHTAVESGSLSGELE